MQWCRDLRALIAPVVAVVGCLLSASGVDAAPDPPENVNVTLGVFPDRVGVYWEPPSTGAASYDVYWSTLITPTRQQMMLLGSTTGLTIEDTGIDVGDVRFYFVYAKDAQGGESGLGEHIDNVHHGSRADGPLTDHLPMRGIVDFVYADAGDKLILSTEDSWVHVYTLAAKTITASYYIGGDVRDIDITPDGNTLIASQVSLSNGFGRVAQVDLSGGAGGSVIRANYAIEDRPDSVNIYIAALDNDFVVIGSGLLRSYNPQTGVFTPLPVLPFTDDTPGLQRNALRTKVAIFERTNPGDITVYDKISGSYFPTVERAGSFGGGSMNRDGTRTSLATGSSSVTIFDGTGAINHVLANSAGAHVFSPTGSILFATRSSGGLHTRGINTATWQDMFEIDHGGGTLSGGAMEVHPSGLELAISTRFNGIQFVDVSAHIPVTPPNPVTAINASDSTTSLGIDLTWAAANLATAYTIYRSTVNDVATASALDTVSATSYLDTGTVPNVTHYYWVQSNNAGGVSALSNLLSQGVLIGASVLPGLRGCNSFHFWWRSGFATHHSLL